MIRYADAMIGHMEISNSELYKRIRNGSIYLGGNTKLKIYGKLQCSFGRRLKRENRIFFESEEEALFHGFRPCGHCLKEKYTKRKMDLFNNVSAGNLLPYGGMANYYGKVMNHKDASHYFDSLLSSIEWKNDEAIVFGKHIITKRESAWYGNSAYLYTYSNITRKALPWTKEVLHLRQIVENVTGSKFNSCLFNLYHNGEEGMAWHSDDENELGIDTVIASLSFGAERKFSFRHKKTKETVSLILEMGSILVMKGSTQKNWMHCLPKSKKIYRPRINLTFRFIRGI